MSQVAAEEVSPYLLAFSPNLAWSKQRVPVLPDDRCARLPILPAETAALARPVMVVGGSRESTTQTDSGSCRRKRAR